MPWEPRQVPISPDCVFDASLVPGTCPGRFLDLKGLINKFLESPDCVFDASLVPGTCPGRFLDLKGLINKFLESPDCVFDASLVPGTCPGRFLDLKGLINKFLESRVTGCAVKRRWSTAGVKPARELVRSTR